MRQDLVFEIVRGASCTFPFEIIEAETDLPPQFENIDEILFVVKQGLDEGSSELIKKEGTVTEGIIYFELDPIDTEELEYGTYFYGITFVRGEIKEPILYDELFMVKKGIIAENE
jgi:hypothetical protein